VGPTPRSAGSTRRAGRAPVSRAISFRHGGRLLDAALDLKGAEARLQRGGRTLTASVRRDRAWIEIARGERVTRCAVAAAANGVWVGLEGRSYFFEVPRGDAAGAVAEEGADEIRAPMTGRVVAVGARPGADVREGDVLVTVEAMKMEFRLVAPRDGTIAEIACGEGERVELGQLLARLEPREPRASGMGTPDASGSVGSGL